MGQTMYFIDSQRRDRLGAGPAGFALGVFEGQSGELVGGIGYSRLNHAFQAAEVGYWIRADRRRRGYGAEATAGVLSWGFMSQADGGWGFRRIFIFAAANNHASCAIPRKLGLRQEVHARLDRWLDGLGWTDTLGWAVLAEEWDVRGSRLCSAG